MSENTGSADKNLTPKLVREFNELRFTGDPNKLIPKMRAGISYLLERSRQKPEEDLVGFFAFRLPDDSHLMPLFERELFEQLVRFHNLFDSESEYVDPSLLMSLDPMLPRIVGEKPHIRGESLFEHELQHYFEWQKRVKGQESSFVCLSLKKKTEGGIRLLSYDVSFMPEDLMTNFDQSLATHFAPRFPSSSDMIMPINKAEKELSRGWRGKIRWYWMMNKVFGYMKQKAREQGLKDYPLQAGELEIKLFPLWREKRKEMIDFPDWYKLVLEDNS